MIIIMPSDPDNNVYGQHAAILHNVGDFPDYSTGRQRTYDEEVEVPKPRNMARKWIMYWFGMQTICIFANMMFYSEVTNNIMRYEAEIHDACGPEHTQDGICVGRLWTLAFDQSFHFEASHYSIAKSFKFETKQHPSTFLTVVEPQEMGSRYTIEMTRTNPPIRDTHYGSGHFNSAGTNTRAFIVSDETASADHPTESWSATLHHRYPRKKKAEYKVYVQEANVDHIGEIHASASCSFESAWKGFNEHHEHLERFDKIRGTVLLTVILSIWLMSSIFLYYEKRNDGESQKMFLLVLFIKFLFIDFPQQYAFMQFIFGWYGRGGLRCQLCLFHPDQCVEEHPFHFWNLILALTLIGGCVVNQLLFRPKRRGMSDDDYQSGLFFRFCIFCMSLLPTITGLYVADASLIWFPRFFHFFLAVPVFVGWLTFIVFCCYPCMCLFDEDEFLY